MPIGSTYHPPLTTRQLLVSVQNVAEAQSALAAGVTWIDLKDPGQGSLGRADDATTRAVLNCLQAADRPVQTSSALGEWMDLAGCEFESLMPGFPIIKLGLAAAAGETLDDFRLQQLQAAASAQGVQVVWAIYADWQRARAAEPAAVLKLAARSQSPYVLIDTWQKDGHGLFSWMTLADVQRIKAQAAEIGATLVVAGSLRTSDWSRLDELGPVVIGIRGAACQVGHDRTSSLCPDRIAQWLEWL